MTEATELPTVSGHARERFLFRSDAAGRTVETAWHEGHEIPGRDWLRGEEARYDPASRCVLVVRDGKIRTAIYAPDAKHAIRRAIRHAGWWP
ncbi:hypothetical protein [Halobacterium litoreum]|uniref:RelE toxin-related domain-containing protein n=1 Tax=Halobacterium litoreum TaxID=2039234 RepID=A0ABD5NHJ0_9EURY|nr:hypothetical protein [Halobacterium litoreum]UHH12425.1 hypothetical protein LT972_09670 [Halobacterium litoreum]